MSTENKKQTLTLGEQRVHLNFNPSSDDKIGTFKRMMADAIDYLNDEMTQRPSDNSDSDFNPEANRCFATAMTYLETAQMYGEKGIAKKL